MCKLRRITNKLSEARSLHIDEVHKNNNSVVIIPTLSPKSYFCRRKDNSSEISCSWNLSKCKTPANQIARNKLTNKVLELFGNIC